MSETSKPLIFARKIRGFGYFRSGGEGGIRTHDTISRIHTFQACSFNRSDTSPDLDRACCPSRRANVAEECPDGKKFF